MRSKQTKQTFLLLLIVFVSGSLFVFSRGMSTYLTLISSQGDIKALGVGVYSDWNCTEELLSINWGMIEPGMSTNVSFYVRNEGNAPITLFLNSTNWNPPRIENYLSLTWNYTGEVLQPQQILPVNLTLTVAQHITGITSFNFDIIIIGEG